MQGRQEVVLAGGQGGVVEVQTGSDKLRYAPLHEFLGQFRVFELFAYRHPASGPHELRQVCVERMVGESGEFHIRGRAVAPARERDAEYLTGVDGIL